MVAMPAMQNCNLSVIISNRLDLRMQTYQKLQSAEAAIVQQVEEKMRSRDPNLFPQRE